MSPKPVNQVAAAPTTLSVLATLDRQTNADYHLNSDEASVDKNPGSAYLGLPASDTWAEISENLSCAMEVLSVLSDIVRTPIVARSALVVSDSLSGRYAFAPTDDPSYRHHPSVLFTPLFCPHPIWSPAVA